MNRTFALLIAFTVAVFSSLISEVNSTVETPVETIAVVEEVSANTEVVENKIEIQLPELAEEITIEETEVTEEVTKITEATEKTEPVAEETQATENTDMHTGRLTARKGRITDSPCGPNGNDGSETWYPIAPTGAVKIMEKEFGFKDLEMTVREDGVRILSGTRPNGETFKELVVVAADVKHEKNPDGIFERGDIVETSLGTGIVVDYCQRSVNERKQSGHVHIDIATTWGGSN